MHRAVKTADGPGGVLRDHSALEGNTSPARNQQQEQGALTPEDHSQSMPQLSLTGASLEANVTCRLGNLSALLVLFLGFAMPALAQSTTGSISGVVVDQSTSVLPGVTVDVRNVETGVQRSMVTDERGRYRALNLAPGRYRVHAELSGFQPVETEDLVVQIGLDVPVDLTLGLGTITESVTVTGESALIDLSGAAVGGVVTTRQIAELPLNGRSFMQLATLQPGVSVSRSTGREDRKSVV